MNLPFTVDQFIGIFRDYNLSIWPMQVVMYVLAGAAVILTLKRFKHADRIISSVLAIIWVWNGLMYQIMYFASINKAAYLFGVFFMLQGMIFLWYGVIKEEIEYSSGEKLYQIVGNLFVVYAAVFYPLIGSLLGHGYPRIPLLGVAPCPTTIFTLGLILLAKDTVPLRVLWIPFFWALVGFNASWALGIREDIGLLVAGLVSAIMIISGKLYLRKAIRAIKM